MAIFNGAYDRRKLVLIVDGVKQYGLAIDKSIEVERKDGKIVLRFSSVFNSPTILNIIRKDAQKLSMEICLLYETIGDGHLDSNMAEYLGDIFTAKSTSRAEFGQEFPIIHFTFTEV